MNVDDSSRSKDTPANATSDHEENGPQPKYHSHYEPSTYPDADVTLVSKDDIHFSVHSTILRLSSSFFRSLFELPGNEDNDKTTPTIPMSEDSRTLSLLLDLLYPGRGLPDIPLFVLFYDVAVAAEKYDMQGTLKTLEKYVLLLRSQYPSTYEPVALYSLARRVSWERVQQVAALHSLSTPFARSISMNNLGERIRCTDVHSLVCLQDWHTRRKRLVLDVIDDLKPSLQTPITLTYEKFTWSYLHNQQPLVRGQTACNLKKHVLNHGRSWELAVQRFKYRVQAHLEETPDGSSIVSDSFWDRELLEFGALKCASCDQVIIHRTCLKTAFESLISHLPKHPEDKGLLVKTYNMETGQAPIFTFSTPGQAGAAAA